MAENPQAFPSLRALDGRCSNEAADVIDYTAETTDGMTLRDYFAAKAMQGLCGGEVWPRIDDGPEMARRAYLYADAMLKARQS